MAPKVFPWSVPDALRLAETHIDAGRRAEALALYERVLEVEPNNAQILCGVGTLSVHFGQAERGAELLRRAIERNRNVADYHVQLAAALIALGRLDEARQAVDRALKLKPRDIDALCSLGCILTKQGDYAGAIHHLQRAIDSDPKSALARQNMGSALHHQGRITDALSSFQAAVSCDPEFAEPYISLVKCLNVLPGASFGLIAEATRRWSNLLPRPSHRPSWSNSVAPDRKLHIGYVSADFRTHSVAFFFENVLRNHDRNAVEITCYSNNEISDETTEKFKTLADRWRLIVGLGDDKVASLMRSDQIDVLVDLTGHTDGGRLHVFIAKPAPIQCTWLGYYATTGLPEIDYIIADRFVVPPADEKFYVERPWRLPDSYLCFTPPDIPVSVDMLPARRGGTITFGSCNSVLKLNKRVVEVWSELLKAVPNTHLVLRSQGLSVPEVREQLGRQFIDNGVPADRVTFLPGGERAVVLATYNAIDIALDPFPYGGGTTTAESLWMGVPVVSMRGDRFTGRVSESILSTVGLPELVVDGEAAYLEKAIELSQDLPRLAELRAGLRDRFVRSPLCDAARFTRHLEEAYRNMWRNWCAAKETAA